jgi:pyruvate dehydrogenase E2 component (dihydrolipoamide acetyltransferase)
MATGSNRTIASPLARHMAQEQGVDLQSLTGSGPNGRIIKRDIEAALAGKVTGSAAASPQAAAPASAAPAPAIASLPDARLFYQADSYTEEKIDPMRAAIAKRLTQSMQELPHFYLTMALPVDALLAFRERMNEALADRGQKVSVNDLLVRACALALMDVPEVNVSFAGDAILRHHHADIGVAVALPDGLITPIVTKCDDKSIADISQDIKSLAALAREKRLKPSQYEGGSFSVSNLGMFGIDQFTAVINPPQAAILAVGGTSSHLEKHGEEIVETKTMRVTLSCDHRAIDGAVGANFLSVLRDYVSKPLLLSL